MSVTPKCGDMVVLGRTGGGRLLRIDRVTATQVICGPFKLSRKTHKVVGASGWCAEYWRLATPEDILKGEIASAKKSLASLKVTAENLGAVTAFLAEQNATKEPSA